jgi:hypothetical protein
LRPDTRQNEDLEQDDDSKKSHRVPHGATPGELARTPVAGNGAPAAARKAVVRASFANLKLLNCIGFPTGPEINPHLLPLGSFLAKAVDAAITGIKVRHAQVVRKHSVRLEQNMREKIRELINKIKITIEGIELPLLRKEALMAKLNAFAAEVDRDRTRSEAFGALIIEIAGGAAKVERKLRPIRKWLDSIARVMHEARVHEDTQGRLPPPIQAPQKQISPPLPGST